MFSVILRQNVQLTDTPCFDDGFLLMCSVVDKPWIYKRFLTKAKFPNAETMNTFVDLSICSVVKNPWNIKTATHSKPFQLLTMGKPEKCLVKGKKCWYYFFGWSQLTSKFRVRLPKKMEPVNQCPSRFFLAWSLQKMFRVRP